MAYNRIISVHANITYFSRMEILDLRGNIPSLTKGSDVIITEHGLSDLKSRIQLLDPNIYHF